MANVFAGCRFFNEYTLEIEHIDRRLGIGKHEFDARCCIHFACRFEVAAVGGLGIDIHFAGCGHFHIAVVVNGGDCLVATASFHCLVGGVIGLHGGDESEFRREFHTYFGLVEGD